MTRRGFFAQFLGLLAAAVGIRKLPAAKPRPALSAPEDLGVTIRMVKCEDGWRMDVLYGFSVIRPEMACRVIG